MTMVTNDILPSRGSMGGEMDQSWYKHSGCKATYFPRLWWIPPYGSCVEHPCLSNCKHSRSYLRNCKQWLDRGNQGQSCRCWHPGFQFWIVELKKLDNPSCVKRLHLNSVICWCAIVYFHYNAIDIELPTGPQSDKCSHFRVFTLLSKNVLLSINFLLSNR